MKVDKQLSEPKLFVLNTRRFTSNFERNEANTSLSLRVAFQLKSRNENIHCDKATFIKSPKMFRSTVRTDQPDK